MNEGLIERWNDTVTGSDEVWVLGDFALARSREHAAARPPAAQAARCWSPATTTVAGRADGTRPATWVERYRDAGFDEILQGSVSVRLGTHDAVACHLPYKGDSHDDDGSSPSARSTKAASCCMATCTTRGRSTAARSTSAPTCGTTVRSATTRSSRSTFAVSDCNRDRSAAAAETAATIHRYTCPLCECMCGLDMTVVESGAQHEPAARRVTLVRGAKDDVWSKGYICPKGSALGHLHHDPDRLRAPMVRDGDQWREVSWDEAFKRCEELVHPILDRDGPTAFTAFVGNRPGTASRCRAT